MKALKNTILIVTIFTFFTHCKSGKGDANQTGEAKSEVTYAGNPIIKSIYTADPAAMVHDDTLYVYTGHDEQVAGAEGFVMNDWYVFSTVDMVNWVNHGARLTVDVFSWAKADAWAAHVVEKDGKFYWYVTVEHATIPGKAVGVAVADHPLGPYKDALGEALITNDMTKQTDIFWDDIDPAVFVDTDGEAHLYWGNTVLKYAKLKSNMVELEGDIQVIDVPAFTEGPYVFKREQKYYLSYSAEFPEVIDYAMADSPEGPWEYKGRLNDVMVNSPTNHQAVVEYKGQWYFIYHSAGLAGGGEFRRSVCVDDLNYNPDGTIQKIIQTDRGVEAIHR
jgi:beta-xylosidase